MQFSGIIFGKTSNVETSKNIVDSYTNFTFANYLMLVVLIAGIAQLETMGEYNKFGFLPDSRFLKNLKPAKEFHANSGKSNFTKIC